MFDIKIINGNIEDNLSNKNYIYLQLDYNNPIIKNNNICYPILNAYLEKTTIDTIDELKVKLPPLPNLDEYTFVNIIYYNNIYKILILKEPIRIINNKITINNHINDNFYILKNKIWDKDIVDISFKSTIDKDKINIIYSNYNIMDNNGNLFFKKNTIDNLYKFILDKGGNWCDSQ